MSALNNPTLVLNKGWNPIHVLRARDAISKALNENAFLMDEENYMLYNWDSWVENFSKSLLDTHNDERYIVSGRMKIRAPEIIVLSKYDRMPKTEIKLTRRNLLIRDNFCCQYTGKRLSLKDATIDHIVPRNKGGKTSWENCVICDWRVNARKANRYPEEAGLKLIKKPTKPKWHPLYTYFTRNRPKSWEKFINTSAWNEEGYWDVTLID